MPISLGYIEDENDEKAISLFENLLFDWLLFWLFFELSPAERIACLNGRGSLFLIIFGLLKGEIPLYSERAVP